MTDCATFGDTKLNSKPILYFPAEETIPAAALALERRCHIEARHLAHPIHHEGELLQEEVPTPGLLYLPNKYVVPGGRFNEMYGWDSYFIILGLLADGRIDLARGMAENFFYEIEHYGSVLNANRTYYLTRSQPPFLSSIVLDIYRAERPTHPAEAKAFLERALPYLIKDHALWTAAPHLAGTTGLSRYFDLGHGPVPEMADDSTYYGDVIAWFLAHPSPSRAYYLKPADTHRPCRPSLPYPCNTTAGGSPFELSDSFYAGDRAMRESGFDTSFRFGAFSGSTADYAPVCLNALLFKYENDIAFIALKLGDNDAAAHWQQLASDRQTVMHRLMWDGRTYTDSNFATGDRSAYAYITSFYVLWAGLARDEEALSIVANLKVFEHPGGLAMSTTHSGMQWDAPFGWAPVNWLAIAGLSRYGYGADAKRIAREFSTTIENNFALDHTIREKYNVESADANVAVSAGYKANVIGFGWTNGVYLQMQRLLAAPSPEHVILPPHHDTHVPASAP